MGLSKYKLGELIELIDERNSFGLRNFHGLNINKEFMPTVRHIFPRQYLKDNDVPKSMYNQVANYVYTQTEINIKIGKKPPKEYLGYVRDVQCRGGETIYGGITDLAALKENVCTDCCLPANLADMTLEDYPAFLEERRRLIASRLKEFYFAL